MRSIERYLLAWILSALALGSVVIALVTYLVTLDEMNDVFDADLKNVAHAVSSYHASFSGALANRQVAVPSLAAEPDDGDIVTITWTIEGRQVYASDPRVALPFTRVEGLSAQHVSGEDWIVYTDVESDHVVQAAQRVAARQDMAGESAAKTIPTVLGLGAAVGGLLVFGLRRGLRPVDGAAREVALRSSRSLEPIKVDVVPLEFRPLVLSINGLLGRLAVAFAAQRRFLADAAHELRTPMTALGLQLQLLKRSHDEASRQQAIAELEAGIGRSQRLVEKLLDVARAEPDLEPMHNAQLDLGDLARTVVARLNVKALEHGIDLGATGAATVVVNGDEDQLMTLLDNLVDNALCYTPSGGVVDVEACFIEGLPALKVVDNGPGIPSAEQSRVFDRFYRGQATSTRAAGAAGSGLGLAIVRAIAERHAAQVSLHTPEAGSGLEVRVVFPATGV